MFEIIAGLAVAFAIYHLVLPLIAEAIRRYWWG